MTSDDARLRETLEKCRAQFAFYYEQHMAKMPPDVAKASVNGDFARMCEHVLATRPAGESAGVAEALREPLEVWRSQMVTWASPEARSALRHVVVTLDGILARTSRAPAADASGVEG